MGRVERTCDNGKWTKIFEKGANEGRMTYNSTNLCTALDRNCKNESGFVCQMKGKGSEKKNRELLNMTYKNWYTPNRLSRF